MSKTNALASVTSLLERCDGCTSRIYQRRDVDTIKRTHRKHRVLTYVDDNKTKTPKSRRRVCPFITAEWRAEPADAGRKRFHNERGCSVRPRWNGQTYRRLFARSGGREKPSRLHWLHNLHWLQSICYFTSTRAGGVMPTADFTVDGKAPYTNTNGVLFAAS